MKFHNGHCRFKKPHGEWNSRAQICRNKYTTGFIETDGISHILRMSHAEGSTRTKYMNDITLSC
jgi:hypothetical protein